MLLAQTFAEGHPTKSLALHHHGSQHLTRRSTLSTLSTLLTWGHHTQRKGAQAVTRLWCWGLNLHHGCDGVPPHAILHQEVLHRPLLQASTDTNKDQRLIPGQSIPALITVDTTWHKVVGG